MVQGVAPEQTGSRVREALLCRKTTMKNAALAIAATGFLLTGCMTFPTPQYVSSTDNILLLRDHRGVVVALGPFTSKLPNPSEAMCRAAGPVKPGTGGTFAEFVRGALAQELAGAQMLASTASITLSGDLELAELSTLGGQWRMALALKSSNGQSLRVSSKTDFNAAWNGVVGCQQAATQFVQAVRDLVAATVSDPSFVKLLR